MADYKDVWIYVEHKSGAFSPMSYELMGIGKKLAGDLGGEVCALVIAENTDELAKEAGYYGASKVYAVDGAAFQTFRADAYAKAASSVIDKYKPDVVLYRATSQGADLSTACAAALETGLASDAIGLEIDADKTVKVLRAAFGGNFLVSVANKKTKPQMATVRPKVFPMSERDASKSAEVVKESVAISEDDLRTKVLQFMKSEVAVNLVEADIIVSGGRGVWQTRRLQDFARPRECNSQQYRARQTAPNIVQSQCFRLSRALEGSQANIDGVMKPRTSRHVADQAPHENTGLDPSFLRLKVASHCFDCT